MIQIKEPKAGATSNRIYLFTIMEVLERLGALYETGELFVYNEQAVFQIYVNKGYIIEAISDGAHGEDLIEKSLLLENPHYSWLPDAAPLQSSCKVGIEECLSKFKNDLNEKKLEVDLTKTISRDAGLKLVSDNKNSLKNKLQFKTDRIPSPLKEQANLLPQGETSYLGEKPNIKQVNKVPSQFYLANEDWNKKFFGLFEGSNLIGRESSCDIYLQDDYQVSRKHAMIEVTKDKIILRDLSSANGSFVNHKAVQECVITLNSIIQLGSHVFILKKH